MKMKPGMNVFLTTSKKSLCYAYPAIKSLFVNNQDSEVFLYIASEDLEEADIQAESAIAAEYGHHIIICRLNEEEARKQIVCSDPEHWPVGAMSCYWMFHELLPDDVDRILAIESDTVTIGSLREAYDTDFEGNYAICPDPEHKPLNHRRIMDELQGDVLTFVASIYDVKKIRKDFSLRDILNMDSRISEKYGQSQMELTFGVLFRGKIKYLPAPEYSVEENHHSMNRFGYDYLKKCEESCKILHFSSTGEKEKPWNPTFVMPGYWYWWKYAKDSPYFKQYFENQWNIYEKTRRDKEKLKKNITYKNVLLATIAIMIFLEVILLIIVSPCWAITPVIICLLSFGMALLVRKVSCMTGRKKNG